VTAESVKLEHLARDGAVQAPPALDVLGYPLRPLRTDGLVELLVDRAASDVRSNVAYLNAHTHNLALDDPALRSALLSFDLLYADGISVVWASRVLGRPLPERMTSADYFPLFARGCAERGVSLFLLGGQPGVAERAAARLRAEVPGVHVAGVRNGYFSAGESRGVVEEVNASGARALVIGLGSPRQECWLHAHSDLLRPALRWCVGALLDYLADAEPRAPRWVCRAGGEWLFRLITDPRGKWRRYLLGNPRFVWHVWKARHGQRSSAAPQRSAETG